MLIFNKKMSESKIRKIEQEPSLEEMHDEGEEEWESEEEDFTSRNSSQKIPNESTVIKPFPPC